MRSSTSSAIQNPSRKGMLLNPTNNPSTLVSTSLLKNIDTFSPLNKKSSTIIQMSRKSQSFGQIYMESPERQEQLKKKQEDWDIFKKNPRFSVLETQSAIDQVSPEQLLEVNFKETFKIIIFFGFI